MSDQLIYAAEKSLRDNGDKITPEIKTGIENKVSSLKKARDGEDVSEIKIGARTVVGNAKIGEHMAKAAKEENKDGKVKDAEFKEGENKEGGSK